jgi:hypothetical protein
MNGMPLVCGLPCSAIINSLLTAILSSGESTLRPYIALLCPMTTFLMLDPPPLWVIVAFCELDVFIERLDLSAAAEAFFYKFRWEVNTWGWWWSVPPPPPPLLPATEMMAEGVKPLTCNNYYSTISKIVSISWKIRYQRGGNSPVKGWWISYFAQ